MLEAESSPCPMRCEAGKMAPELLEEEAHGTRDKADTADVADKKPKKGRREAKRSDKQPVLDPKPETLNPKP